MCATVTDLDFSAYDISCNRDFASRERLLRAVDVSLVEPVPLNCILLTCESSSGKTAIARHLKQFAQGRSYPVFDTQAVKTFAISPCFLHAWCRPYGITAKVSSTR